MYGRYEKHDAGYEPEVEFEFYPENSGALEAFTQSEPPQKQGRKRAKATGGSRTRVRKSVSRSPRKKAKDRSFDWAALQGIRKEGKY